MLGYILVWSIMQLLLKLLLLVLVLCRIQLILELSLNVNRRVGFERSCSGLRSCLIRLWKHLLLELSHLDTLGVLRRFLERVGSWIDWRVDFISLLHLQSVRSIESYMTHIHLCRSVCRGWTSIKTLMIWNIALWGNIQRAWARILSRWRLSISLLFIILIHLKVSISWRYILSQLIDLILLVH